MKLMAVTDNHHAVKDIAEKIIAVKDVIDYVQIREKSKTAQELVTLINYLLTNGVHKEKIIINDRLDVALCLGIPTVHLPEHGLPVQLVKQHYPQIRVGCSVHSLQSAREAEVNGADYVLYGHCFETNSKKGVPPNGINPILKMKEELTIPVYAIGGINIETIPIVKDVGGDGIAVMSSIFATKNPLESAEKLREAMQHEK